MNKFVLTQLRRTAIHEAIKKKVWFLKHQSTIIGELGDYVADVYCDRVSSLVLGDDWKNGKRSPHFKGTQLTKAALKLLEKELP